MIVLKCLFDLFLGIPKHRVPAVVEQSGMTVNEGYRLTGKVNIDFFSGPAPSGTYADASLELVEDKENFGLSRKARWFGL